MNAASASVAPSGVDAAALIRQILPRRRWWWRILLVNCAVHLVTLVPALAVVLWSPHATEAAVSIESAVSAAVALLWLLALFVLERSRGRLLLQAVDQWQIRLLPTLYRAGWRAAMWGDRATGVAALRDLAAVRACLTGPGLNGLLDLPWVPVYVVLAGWVVGQGEGDPATLWGWLALAWLGLAALAPIRVVLTHRAELQAGWQALQRIHACLLPGASAHPQLIWHPAAHDEALVLDDVSAWVPGAEKAILRSLNLVVPRGQLLAVVGTSGAGKTTLGRVVSGAWPCAFGGVWCAAGPRQLGYLPQEVTLVPGTVADNIARLATPDLAAVVAAAQRTGLHEFILRLPQAYDTVVGEGGHPLSAGVTQRIGLARAIYGRPRLLILDEPANHLDEAGELALESLLQWLRAEGCAVILLTQARAMLRVVDRILILDSGRIAADEALSRTGL
ncbi:MAG: ATP-binding cassette domain-containing protein [Rhodoferax sp.]|nr:MAG: ATP-binding cassette domain-containing protein [Rhodoferax sp.]